MARIVTGPLITSLKGSISGLTFQNNPSGLIVRSRPTLKKASTVKQTTAHASLYNWLSLWQALTQDQRDAWNEYATAWTKINKFGETKTLTGLNWYISSNQYIVVIGASIFSDPPVHTLPQAPPDFYMTMTATDLKVNLLAAFDWNNNALLVWASLPTRKNTTSINQIRKLVSILYDPHPDTIDIKSDWETATGLSWNPSVDFPSANIYVCLESVSSVSGITSSMLCTKNTTPAATDDEMIFYV